MGVDLYSSLLDIDRYLLSFLSSSRMMNILSLDDTSDTINKLVAGLSLPIMIVGPCAG